MGVVQRGGDLAQQGADAPQRQRTVTGDDVGQRVAGHQAHGDVKDAVGLADVVDGDDVGMLLAAPPRGLRAGNASTKSGSRDNSADRSFSAT